MNLQLTAHILALQALHGKRIRLLDLAEVTQGWLVNKVVPPGFWSKCKLPVYPLQAKWYCGIFPSKAARELDFWISKYDAQIMTVLIPDDETMNEAQHSGGPILISDLDENPQDLLKESLEQIKHDQRLSGMKQRAAMMLMGVTDLKVKTSPRVVSTACGDFLFVSTTL